MPMICYEPKRFNDAHMEVIVTANAIIDEYQAQGYRLTLRQLYYQFVARGLLGNTQQKYKWLGSIISDGRMAGLIDWLAIEDRTRNLKAQPSWSNPASIIRSAADSYAIQKWQDQENYVEVWVEKDALLGVVERICNKWMVPFFSCRGYTSASEMWIASQRFVQRNDKVSHIIHLGDHDPSGVDMTRDIESRIDQFLSDTKCPPFTIHRVALNMDQVEEYNPPPNPAKITDSRAAGYIRRHGRESWELDALEPQVMSKIIESKIKELVDIDRFHNAMGRESEQREQLTTAADNWGDVVEFLENL